MLSILNNSRIENKRTSGYVIRDFNDTIKMAASRYISNTSIIIVKYMTLRNYMLVVKNNGLLNLIKYYKLL